MDVTDPTFSNQLIEKRPLTLIVRMLDRLKLIKKSRPTIVKN